MINNVSNKGFTPQNISKPNDVELSVFYTNDMHGDLKKLAQLKTAKDTFEKQNVTIPKMILSGGDTFLGADKPRNKFLVEFMNKFKLDATALGNHEFSAKSKGLAENLEGANFKSVCANIEVSENNKLAERLKDKKLVKSAVFMKGGHKFGVIGAAPFDSYIGKNEDASSATKVFDMKKTISSINKEAEELEKQGVNKIILCSHLGYKNDLELAEKSKGIDIIVGGHSHTKIDGVNKDKVNLLKSDRNEPVVITQAGGLNEKAGFLNVVFDEKGVLRENKIVNKLMDVSSFAPDKSINVLMEKRLGKNEVLAKVKTSYAPKNNVEERILNNPVHNHFADAIMQRGKEHGVKVSVFGAPSLRGGIKDAIKTYDVKYAMLPFDSAIKLVDLSEKDLVSLLNVNTDDVKAHKNDAVIYRTGNMKYTFCRTPQINSNGEKVYIKDLTFLDDGSKIDTLNPGDKKIKVAIDDYSLRRNFPNLVDSAKIIGKEQEIFIEYLNTKKEIDTNLEPRQILS